MKLARHAVSLAVAAVFGLTVAWQTGLTDDAQVQVADGHILINATTVPLSVVLDRISHSTGMKVVYEGAPPSDRVTVAIDARSETEALARLLEGLGLTHAFKLDASGKRVETLFISTVGGSGSSSGSSSGRRATSSRPSVATEPVEEMSEDPAAAPETPPDPSSDPALVNANPGAGSMGGTMGSPLAPGTAPEIDQNASPGFPGAASYPTSPGVNPTFPGPRVPFPVPPNPYSFPSR